MGTADEEALIMAATATQTRAADKAPLPDGLEGRQRYWAIFTLMTALTATVMDSVTSNVALPTIARDLAIDPASVVWVNIAYSLTVVVFLLPFSAAAERVGFRRMFAVGVTLFMVSSLGSALSQSLPVLTGFRIAQGLGSAMLMCMFGGLVRNIYPLRDLGFGLSVNAMTVGMVSVLGPSLGAFLLKIASWHWIFAINVPLCLLAYVGIRCLPEVPRNRTRFDWIDCGLSMLFFGLAIIGLDGLGTTPMRAVLCLLLAGVAGLFLVRRSYGQTAPLVPIDLLRIKPVGFAVGASGFSFAAQTASFVSLPFYFEKVMGHGYVEIGVFLGAWSIGVAVMAPIAGSLSNRYSVAVLCAIGALGMALGLLWIVLLPLQADLPWIMAAMLLSGVGFGFFQTPNNRAMLAGAPRRRSGAAGGLQATTRVFGQSFGTALVGIAFSFSTEGGAIMGVSAAILCALAAVALNVVRHFDPAADPKL